MGYVRAEHRKFHIIYKTTCKSTGKFYVGMHSTDNLNDGYLGSGTILSRSVKKYGKNDHEFKIIEFLPTRTALRDREKEFLTEELRSDPLCMNIAVGGIGGIPSSPKRCAEKLKRLQDLIDEDIAKISMTREQVLKLLLTDDGHLKKRISRYLTGKDKSVKENRLSRREQLVAAKWAYVWNVLQNPHFGNAPHELLYAYVNHLKCRPTCLTCGAEVSFGRFAGGYKKYCDSKCQMRDPNFINPVLSRWKKQDS